MESQEKTLLNEYLKTIKRIKKQCLDDGLSEEEFRKIYLECMYSISTSDISQTSIPASNYSRRIAWKHGIFFVTFVILFYAAYDFKSLYSCLVCNLQDFVYPGLRMLRRISIPLISFFPPLTNLYHESCLMQNPFFTIIGMDCWPCSTVTNIREIYNPKPVHQQHSAPFIYKTDQHVTNINKLRDLYDQHRDIFNKESPKVLVNNKFSISPKELFQKRKDGTNHSFYIWRFNSMNAARVLRNIITRPKVVPKFGQSIERFLIIDSSKKQFPVPDTECNFSFILSLSGETVVKLLPAEECKTQCKTLKIQLEQTYLLWYNWWYWRPMMEPSNGNSTLIAYVGSYC